MSYVHVSLPPEVVKELKKLKQVLRVKSYSDVIKRLIERYYMSETQIDGTELLLRFVILLTEKMKPLSAFRLLDYYSVVLPLFHSRAYIITNNKLSFLAPYCDFVIMTNVKGFVFHRKIAEQNEIIANVSGVWYVFDPINVELRPATEEEEKRFSNLPQEPPDRSKVVRILTTVEEIKLRRR